MAFGIAADLARAECPRISPDIHQKPERIVIMKTLSSLTAALIGASLLATLPLAAIAKEPVVVETIVQEPVVVEAVLFSTYLNGGVGKDEEATMRRLAKEFPLRMTFSERKDGDFVADVPVIIFDASGNPVFELPKAGPMLYVMLPHGEYRVMARFKGLTESQNVTLSGKEGKDLSFHWKK
ncbi:MAG: hypothetical protein CRU78_06335 [Candidatus Accumulibacter phosphatis]|uniref:Carboxypeptidase regulatory-like domain-containing protein n=1 Tax=Candidatus Accumulibacter phosphatis TaxID=327160 RepID=A0A6A7RTD6_9PROT|nr:hypothetical protein [Candidatus Accumulibacter phosphatis]